jgi:3-phenylpropionate/trans-cinnamate dioxygenase ferredoxin component
MPRWVAACSRSSLELDDVLPFQHEGSDYAIYRTSTDRFYATDGHCTHERTLLCDGLVMDGVIECPKHNGRFDIATGRAKGAPVIVNLKTYPVRVDGDTVYVDLD